MKARWLYSILNKVVPTVGALYIHLIGKTTRLKIIGPPGLQTPKDIFSQGRIFCVWHSRFLYFAYFGRRRDVTTMISSSQDGDLIVHTIKKFGLGAIRGSSSKQGKEAMYALANHLLEHKGASCLMVPDGPKGPRYKLKPGVVRIAQLTGLPIVLGTFSSTHAIFFSSWDRFLLPLPFGKGIVRTSGPFWIPPTTTEEEFNQICLDLEEEMERIRKEADQLCGQSPPD